jgi:hypothetical protein
MLRNLSIYFRRFTIKSLKKSTFKTVLTEISEVINALLSLTWFVSFSTIKFTWSFFLESFFFVGLRFIDDWAPEKLLPECTELRRFGVYSSGSLERSLTKILGLLFCIAGEPGFYGVSF